MLWEVYGLTAVFLKIYPTAFCSVLCSGVRPHAAFQTENDGLYFIYENSDGSADDGAIPNSGRNESGFCFNRQDYMAKKGRPLEK